MKASECGCGAATCVNCGPILKLMDAVDTYMPNPVREMDKPFLMSIEDVFSIKGRGTVATGRVERGKVKVGDDVDIVGIKPDVKKSVVTGVEMFNKTLDEGQAGDNLGGIVEGVEPEDLERGRCWRSLGVLHRTRSMRLRLTY